MKGDKGMKPQYFDLTVVDVEAARKFFEACLGWKFVPFEPFPGYFRIQACAPGEPGIDGGIAAAKDAPLSAGRPLTVMTIPVADVDDIIGKVERNGGRIVEPKRAIPGISWFCTCTEPGGLLFGVLQQDESANREE
jgi:predicted enzyme related to lactoylglutathione lyase